MTYDFNENEMAEIMASLLYKESQLRTIATTTMDKNDMDFILEELIRIDRVLRKITPHQCEKEEKKERAYPRFPDDPDYGMADQLYWEGQCGTL